MYHLWSHYSLLPAARILTLRCMEKISVKSLPLRSYSCRTMIYYHYGCSIVQKVSSITLFKHLGDILGSDTPRVAGRDTAASRSRRPGGGRKAGGRPWAGNLKHHGKLY